MCTYERPAHLRLALLGYRLQGFRDFEIVVADDGSGPETAAVVERFAVEAPFPVRHVWQEDRGYRRTAILNRAIAAAAADYIVFTDGDCVPAPDLLDLHAALRRPARMLIGGFVRVPRDVGDRAGEDWVLSGRYRELLTAEARRALRRRQRKNVWQIWTRRRRRPHNLGLNMSLWREDLMRVNGFDENIVNWGNDDGDLRDRLRQVGVRPLSVWDRALVFHLDHEAHPSSLRPQNRAYARRPDAPAFAENGIVKRSPA
jgi:glycosyltransferase involved in cell wall biosynthesis